MTEEYIIFKQFKDPAMLAELVSVLKENNIDYVVEDFIGTSTTFTNDETNREYVVKLKKEKFEKVNELLMEISMNNIDEVDKDYYLFEFSDEELTEIIMKPDEWSEFDYLLAQRILSDKGKEISPEQLNRFKKQRLQELAQPTASKKVWIFLGYLFALFGGVVAIIFGYVITTSKKTLPNGEQVYDFTPADRKHGNRIFVLGIIFFIISSALWAFYSFASEC